MAFHGAHRDSIEDKAGESEAFLPDDQFPRAPKHRRSANKPVNLLRYTAIAAMTASYLFLLVTHVRAWVYGGSEPGITAACAADVFEAIYADAPLQKHRQVIEQRALRSYFNTPEDPGVQQAAAEWEHDVGVGMIAISAEELAKIPGNKDSAPLHNPSDSHLVEGLYVIQTSTSHQMTCLKIIHDTLWELAVAGIKDPYNLQHTDHCLGYLRQLVRCRADLTPIRFEWVADYHAYMTGDGFEEHACRDWDAVWEWQRGRNTTGVMVAQGKHASLPGTPGHHIKPGETMFTAEWQEV